MVQTDTTRGLLLIQLSGREGQWLQEYIRVMDSLQRSYRILYRLDTLVSAIDHADDPSFWSIWAETPPSISGETKIARFHNGHLSKATLDFVARYFGLSRNIYAYHNVIPDGLRDRFEPETIKNPMNAAQELRMLAHQVADGDLMELSPGELRIEKIETKSPPSTLLSGDHGVIERLLDEILHGDYKGQMRKIEIIERSLALVERYLDLYNRFGEENVNRVFRSIHDEVISGVETLQNTPSRPTLRRVDEYA